ncbi:MAG: methyl-accepting chemotaxis protein [Moraxella sp.]|nr:methyl-accepting chemotaxis protein [Moraxella sp.]
MSDINQATVIAQKRNSGERTWLIALIVFGIIALLSLAYLVNSLLKVTDYFGQITQMEVAAANIVKDVNEAAFSRDVETSASAYDRLQHNVQQYETALNRMSDAYMANPAVFKALNADWQAKKEQVTYVLEHKNDVDALQDVRKQVVEALERVQNDYGVAMEQALAARLSSNAIKDIRTQSLRVERMMTEIKALTTDANTSSESFKSLSAEFGQVLEMQVQTFGLAVPALQSASTNYKDFIAPVAEQLESLKNPAIQSRESAQALVDTAINAQEQLLLVDRNAIKNPHILGAAAGLLLGLLGAAFALVKLLGVRRRVDLLVSKKELLSERHAHAKEQADARKMQAENERNQMAILRLLDELDDLAKGDLTVNATVSEDFTGAIADSVNFAIDQMRQVVSAINITADRVAESSRQTQKTAVELTEASEHQAKEIAGVSAAISAMALSIDQVSANAAESATVAERSVDIAHNGAVVVQRSIEGMNIIRDQIQETSKRIKRLGESSQEIGDIVNLINDIADQTNILALNAAIQASMAGEAGRGFAVVADEVQRLAERSANATRQIETLVKTIQADTNEAVMSMESTTAEVVKGARLAKDAGEALEEVQSVSNTLAELIQNISTAAQQQAASAGHISGVMTVIQGITSQTSAGTLATARSVARLNEMAAALQESVSGFKLSNDDAFIDDVFLDEDEFKAN